MNLTDNSINYIEFKAKDLNTTKAFYSGVFNWKFTDYGHAYASFEESGIAGGFEKTDEIIQNGVLVVLYHSDLISVKEKVIKAGG
jgi:predicted enzyme related to lactoylglutathione lyase